MNGSKNNISKYNVKEILGSQMCLLKDDPGISAQLLVNENREWDSPSIVNDILQKGWNCIDIGANLGYYALLEAKLVGENGKVFAVDPVQQNIDALYESALLNNYQNLHVYSRAIGDKNGDEKISISCASNGGTMFDLEKASELGRETIERENIEFLNVKVNTLDKFVKETLKDEPLNFLRMDVEGYEVEIIEGAKETLSNMPIGSMIFIELHPVLFENPKQDLLPTVESILSYNFMPYKVVLGDRTEVNVSNEEMKEMIWKKYPKGWILVFLEKLNK